MATTNDAVPTTPKARASVALYAGLFGATRDDDAAGDRDGDANEA